MTERVSEESNESFNGTLVEIRDRLKSMSGTKQQIGVTNSRTQGNLKGEILEEKICTGPKSLERRGVYKNQGIEQQTVGYLWRWSVNM